MCVISTQRRYYEKIYQEITTANWGLATTNQPTLFHYFPLKCSWLTSLTLYLILKTIINKTLYFHFAQQMV